MEYITPPFLIWPLAKVCQKKTTLTTFGSQNMLPSEYQVCCDHWSTSHCRLDDVRLSDARTSLILTRLSSMCICIVPMHKWWLDNTVDILAYFSSDWSDHLFCWELQYLPISSFFMDCLANLHFFYAPFVCWYAICLAEPSELCFKVILLAGRWPWLTLSFFWDMDYPTTFIHYFPNFFVVSWLIFMLFVSLNPRTY
jgi:hypothetical protein